MTATQPSQPPPLRPPHVQVAAFKDRPLCHVEFPYVYLNATYLKVRDPNLHQVVSKAVVVATGITAGGDREVLGLAVGDSEAETFWSEFLRGLRNRGLCGMRLVISDEHDGLTKAVRRVFRGASWRRCRVHFAGCSSVLPFDGATGLRVRPRTHAGHKGGLAFRHRHSAGPASPSRNGGNLPDHRANHQRAHPTSESVPYRAVTSNWDMPLMY
jgi:Transposase, Mutator family